MLPLTHGRQSWIDQDTCTVSYCNCMHEKLCVLKALRSSGDQYPWSACNQHLDRQTIDISNNTWSTLNQHLIDILTDARSTFVDSQLSVNWLICVDLKFVDSRPRCQSSIDWVSTQTPMEGQLRVSTKGIDGLSTANSFSIHYRLYPWVKKWNLHWSKPPTPPELILTCFAK